MTNLLYITNPVRPHILSSNVQTINTDTDILNSTNLSRLGIVFNPSLSLFVPYPENAKRVVDPALVASFFAGKKNTYIPSNSDMVNINMFANAFSISNDEKIINPSFKSYQNKYFSHRYITFFTKLASKFGKITIDLISINKNNVLNNSFINEMNSISNTTGVNIQITNLSDASSFYDVSPLIGISSYVYTGYELVSYLNANNDQAVISYLNGVYTLLQNISVDNFFNILLNEGEVFDGNNNVIYINNSTGLFLFNSVSKSTTIKNLYIENTNIPTFEGNIGGGGLISPFQSNFTLNNCSGFIDNMTDFCGGFVGANCSNFDIIKCFTAGNMGSCSSVLNGGFCAGFCSNFNIRDSVNYISNNNNGIVDGSGQIVGPLCNNFTVDNCCNFGYMYSQYTGGICGAYCNDFVIKRCSNYLYNVDVDYMYYASGGITGYSFSNFTLEYCKNNKDI